MDILSAVETAIDKLKGKKYTVAGPNKNFNVFRSCWIGTPEWQYYNVHFPDGRTEKESYKSFNMPRYLTRAWANNYANEDTVISIATKGNDRLQEILKANNFFGKWNNFVEAMMGLGIGAVVVNLKDWEYEAKTFSLKKSDTDVKLSFVRGERVFPITIDDGEVTECAFVTFRTGGCKLIIHYLNEEGNYSIAEVNATSSGEGYVFDFDKIDKLNINSNIPLFQCWTPNIENDDEEEYGTSILSKAYDAFMQCDVDYTALYKEIKLGGKIKYIRAELFNIDTNGNKQTLIDVNDESIVAVDSSSDNNEMRTYADNLRTTELIQSLNFNMNLAAMLCGLGSNQFEFDGAGGRPIQTATGVIAKQTELYRNVIKQENYATFKLKDMVRAIIFLNDNYTNNPAIGEVDYNDINVVYDDNIVEDTASKRENDMKEVSAGIMSIAEYRAEWYDEGIEEAIKFVQENGLLIDKYTLALQSHVITPEMFVDFAFGENYKYKNELVAYIKQAYNLEPQEDTTGFEDEGEEEEQAENEETESNASQEDGDGADA